MQKDSVLRTIKIVATLTAATGLYELVPGWGSMLWFFSNLFTGEYTSEYGLLWVIPVSTLIYLVWFLKLVAAYGLVRLAAWGRWVAIGTLSIDFASRLWGAINIWTYSLRHAEPPTLPTEGGTVIYISFWPSYIIALISLGSLIVLLRKDIKRSFGASLARESSEITA